MKTSTRVLPPAKNELNVWFCSPKGAAFSVSLSELRLKLCLLSPWKRRTSEEQDVVSQNVTISFCRIETT